MLKYKNTYDQENSFPVFGVYKVVIYKKVLMYGGNFRQKNLNSELNGVFRDKNVFLDEYIGHFLNVYGNFWNGQVSYCLTILDLRRAGNYVRRLCHHETCNTICNVTAIYIKLFSNRVSC